MIKTARQLKDWIRNLSKSKSADAQVLMRNYMMERFLERISLSEYRDTFNLKGSYKRITGPLLILGAGRIVFEKRKSTAGGWLLHFLRLENEITRTEKDTALGSD